MNNEDHHRLLWSCDLDQYVCQDNGKDCTECVRNKALNVKEPITEG